MHLIHFATLKYLIKILIIFVILSFNLHVVAIKLLFNQKNGHRYSYCSPIFCIYFLLNSLVLIVENL